MTTIEARNVITKAIREARERLEQDPTFDFARASVYRFDGEYRAESARENEAHFSDYGRDVWVDAETGRAIMRVMLGGPIARGVVFHAAVYPHRREERLFVSARFDTLDHGEPVVEWSHALAYLAGCDEHDDCRTCVPLARDCWRARNR